MTIFLIIHIYRGFYIRRGPRLLLLLPMLLSRLYTARSVAVHIRLMSSAHNTNPWAEQLPKPVDEMNTYLAVMPDFTEGSKRCAAKTSCC